MAGDDRQRFEVITGTHPEYSSLRMHEALARYVAEGGRLMHLGGNGFYWRITSHAELPGAIEVRRAEDGNRSWACEPGEYDLSFDGHSGRLWRRRVLDRLDRLGRRAGSEQLRQRRRG